MISSYKKKVAQALSSVVELPEGELFKLLEVPKNIEHGHVAFPTFTMAKTLRKAPPLIAQDVVQKLKTLKNSEIQDMQAVGGYVNFTLSESFVLNTLKTSILQCHEKIGHSRVGEGKKAVIDYSSPNVAKPMSIGHLRATVIGQAIRNLALSQGYEVLGINYLGDWGVQFGKLAWAYLHWKDEYPFAEKPFESLYNLYVRFHEEAEKNQSLDEEGAKVFKRLEAKDPEIIELWKMFLEISLKEYNRIYGMLNIHFDLIQGESFHNEHLEPTIEKIRDKGILEESQGAQVVYVGEDIPPCIIQKSDGASLYATRDIASAIYRHEELKGDLILYVVGVDQSLHFQQVFKVLQLMDYDWAKNCHHITFGMYRFKDIGKMSTRKGNVIFMDDVLKKSIEMAAQIIQEKNPTLENREEVAQQVGVGAIIFNDLVSDRVKNVDFNWDRVLDFEGDSGPYVQYCLVRCRSILRKYEKPVPTAFKAALNQPEEENLIKDLMLYEETLQKSFASFKPSVLAQYLLNVCKSFNHYYAKHKILTGDLSLVESRVALVASTAKVLESGLSILGIEAPQSM